MEHGYSKISKTFIFFGRGPIEYGCSSSKQFHSSGGSSGRKNIHQVDILKEFPEESWANSSKQKCEQEKWWKF